MGWIIRLGKRVIGHVTDEYSVLEPKIATLIENCLLAYQVSVHLGEDARTPLIYGFKVIGNPDKVAIAVKRCIAHTLHRRVTLEEEKIYEAQIKNKEGENKNVEEELFKEA